MAFPNTLPSYTITAGAETANGAGGGTGLSGLLNAFEVDITALGAKVGIGATTPAANTLLFGTGAGTTAWQGLTSAQLAAILSDETGSGALVFANSPTIVTPTIASFTNAQHNHSNAAGGGALNVTSPQITTAINDSNNNKIIGLNPVASSVNYPQADNAATGGTPVVGFEANGTDTNLHFQAIGKGNGLTKVSVLRQSDTTNAYKHNSVILSGWGTMTTTAVTVVQEGVTFGITFAQRPIVVITMGGDEAVASATYGNGGNSVQGQATAKIHTVTTTTFQAYVWAPAAWSNGNGVYYQWIAIGEL